MSQSLTKTYGIKTPVQPLMFILALITIIMAGCYNDEQQHTVNEPQADDSTNLTKEPREPLAKGANEEEQDTNPKDQDNDEDMHIPEPVKITLAAVGDIMVHSPQYRAQYDQATQSYDFRNNFEYVKKYLQQADLSLANLETTFAGEEFGYSGYPRFNSPDALADALDDAGIDILSFANNHSIDTGIEGFSRTLEVIEDANMTAIGAKKNPTDKSYIVKDVQGVKIGLAAYTFETPSYMGARTINGILLPEALEERLDSFSYENLEEDLQRMENRVELLKNEGADFIVFYLHWGQEYQRSTNTYQQKMAQALANAGVDIIFGSHPHVIQPVEYRPSENENRQTLVVYSLGNFLSNQRYEYMNTRYTEDGLIINVELEKDFEANRTSIVNVTYIPTWVHLYSQEGKNVYEILPLIDTAEIETFQTLSEANRWRAENAQKNTRNLLEEHLNDDHDIPFSLAPVLLSDEHP